MRPRYAPTSDPRGRQRREPLRAEGRSPPGWRGSRRRPGRGRFCLVPEDLLLVALARGFHGCRITGDYDRLSPRRASDCPERAVLNDVRHVWQAPTSASWSANRALFQDASRGSAEPRRSRDLSRCVGRAETARRISCALTGDARAAPRFVNVLGQACRRPAGR